MHFQFAFVVYCSLQYWSSLLLVKLFFGPGVYPVFKHFQCYRRFYLLRMVVSPLLADRGSKDLIQHAFIGISRTDPHPFWAYNGRTVDQAIIADTFFQVQSSSGSRTGSMTTYTRLTNKNPLLNGVEHTGIDCPGIQLGSICIYSRKNLACKMNTRARVYGLSHKAQ